MKNGASSGCVKRFCRRIGSARAAASSWGFSHEFSAISSRTWSLPERGARSG